MLLEICAASLTSAINAQKAGAHRIELCENLGVGGITPSKTLIKKTRESIDLPIFVLIRPRAGDFCYSEREMEEMLDAIAYCKEQGCDGIVSGVLKEDQTIDLQRTAQLIAAASPLPFTFHRAFDLVPNPREAIKSLKFMEIRRVLTSGQSPSAELGIDLLRELRFFETEAFSILPGGGINPKNVKLFRNEGFREVHSSAMDSIKNDSYIPGEKKSDLFISEKRGDSKVEIIREMIRIMNNS